MWGHGYRKDLEKNNVDEFYNEFHSLLFHPDIWITERSICQRGNSIRFDSTLY
jgi:hypothetical protein